MESHQNQTKHPSVLLLGLMFLFIFNTSTWAQAPIPPTPIEFMFGHERLDFQLVFKRNFTPKSKLSVLAIAVTQSANDAAGYRLTGFWRLQVLKQRSCLAILSQYYQLPVSNFDEPFEAQN